MNEPTKEQIKEFWEEYRVIYLSEMGYHGYYHLFGLDGREWVGDELPDIDLNALFKYAPHRMTAILWRKIIREWASSLTGDYENDTNALFWALMAGKGGR